MAYSALIKNYDASVFKEGAVVIAVNRNGEIIHSGVSDADDAHVIQLAINSVASGGSVHLNGTFTIETMLTLVSNLTLSGTGAYTILNAKAALDTDIIRATDKTNVIIKDFKIDGKKATQTPATTGSGIHFATTGAVSSYSVIQDVIVVDCMGYGIQVDAAVGFVNVIGGTLSGNTIAQSVFNGPSPLSIINSAVDINSGTIDAVTIAGTTPVTLGLSPTVGSPSEGAIYWDATNEVPNVRLHNGVNLELGEKELRRVYNAGGSPIPIGSAVYTNGVGGTPDIVTVALAQANAYSTSFVLGVSAETIAATSYGFIVVRGTISPLDTSLYDGAAGDSLYLSATTPGGLTSTIPDAPNFEVRVGRLIKKHASGNINVRINATGRLTDLSDVAVSGAVANQLLKFDGVSWVPADSSTTSSAGGTDFFLTDTDTDIENLSNAAACVVTWTGHGLVGAKNYVKFEGITQVNWTALNSPSGTSNVFYEATIINNDSFSIPVDTTTFGAYVPGVDPGKYSTGRLPSTPVTTIAESIDSAQSTGNVEALIDSYCTQAPLGRTTIEGGEWVFKTWCYASSISDTNIIVIRVYKRTVGGVETELFNVSTEDLGTSNVLSQISSVQPAFAINSTDHLVIKYYAKSNRGGGQYRTCYLTHNGTTHYSYVKTPIALTHNNLGGLNEGAYRHAPASTAASDFVVGEAATGNWVKKTLAETQAILLVSPGPIGGTTPGAGNFTTLKATTDAAAGKMLISDGSGNLGYLAAGATTEILVGGGAANPVWTTATGTGAPARADSPVFTTQITTPQIVTADNAATEIINIPVTGVDASTHTISLQVDGDTGISVAATGDGAGHVGAKTINVGVGGDADVVHIGDANALVDITDAHWSMTEAGVLSIVSMGSNWTNAGRTVADAGILTTVDINGGSIDGAVIGANSASTGVFTTLKVTTSAAAGSILVSDNDGDLGYLAVGTPAQVLKVAAGGTTLEWGAGGGGAGITWNEVTGTSANAAADNGYICNNAALVTITLPASMAVGKVVEVTGSGAGGWKLQLGAGDTIHFGNLDTTSGGYLASSHLRDSVRIVCVVADAEYNVLSSVGNITIA